MENGNNLRLSVSEFIALTNQTLEYAYPLIEVEGEVSGFKLNQGKYVFFDLKDGGGSVGCFMMAWQLRAVIEDGMKVVVSATPKLTAWGKFSLTVRTVRLSGEGSLRKGFELLKAKLEKEGVFASERKRVLPSLPRRIAVISSTEAAGYKDFIKILDDRWGGMTVEVAHVQVQGADAPDQIIRALNHFNAQEALADVIVIVRGGGSLDDLSAFNDERLVREIAASRIPTLIGVGHEVDHTLADLAADVRAATPSNAAQLLVPERKEVIRGVQGTIGSLLPRIEQAIDRNRRDVQELLFSGFGQINQQISRHEEQLENLGSILAEMDPRRVLRRGYALVRGDIEVGKMIEIEKNDILVRAEVHHVDKK